MSETSQCRRIAVFGPPGSGKTTFGAYLGAYLHMRHVDLEFWHGPDKKQKRWLDVIRYAQDADRSVVLGMAGEQRDSLDTSWFSVLLLPRLPDYLKLLELRNIHQPHRLRGDQDWDGSLKIYHGFAQRVEHFTTTLSLPATWSNLLALAQLVERGFSVHLVPAPLHPTLGAYGV